MTGEQLLQKLLSMSTQDRAKEIIIEDYSGVTAQYITLDNDVNLKYGRVDQVNDPDGILNNDYISLSAEMSYFLG